MSGVDEEKIKELIPAQWHMISGSHDTQTSADVNNVGQFQLPDPAGRAGGACTSALLKVLYRDGHASADMSWVQCLRTLRSELANMGYDQIPQLCSSRMIDVNETMYIVPPGSKGHRRAIMIGINYVGQKGQLSGCHNDVGNMIRYLVDVQGFKESEMLVLMDDGKHHPPTKRNIIDAFVRMTQYSQAGDVVFVHYSGHGSRVADNNGDEDDGYDETIIPVDYQSAGQIIDDDILKILVQPMRTGVTCTVLMDCCHSGTVMDLPYRFSADDTRMRLDHNSVSSILASLGASREAVMCCACIVMTLLQLMQDDRRG